jgi:transketolase
VGKANVIRFRGEKENFIDAFETKLASEHQNENEDLTIVACGQMVPEALRAAWILKKEFNLETRVVNLHTIKPLDEEALTKAALETKAILTVEEHQVGGVGGLVAGSIARKKNLNDQLVMDMMGVEDRFGESGKSWTVLKYFGLTAEHIADRARKLVDRKK